MGLVKTILIRDDTLAHIKNDLVEISQSNVNSKGLTHVQITLNKNEIIHLANKLQSMFGKVDICIHCDKVIDAFEMPYRYKNRKQAHLGCHIYNNRGRV
ncbi:hypothetical protein RW25_29105 [Bacillus sp. L_1B0_8]|nr:hypothetical protein RW25_29105 [Bacillus sp. L_1B0_8]KIQ77561.1 hypothetical protein RT27_30955 [Bacillus sp. L_1B0_5]